MRTRLSRAWVLVLVLSLLLSTSASGAYGWQGSAPQVSTPNPVSPALANAGFECAEGYVGQPGIEGLIPAGWTGMVLSGQPKLTSTRIKVTGNCGEGEFVERLEGDDSLMFVSQDIETPPDPGKPFDALVYQQVPVIQGTAYSLSGWMVSLCGGSAMPNDCPQGYYINKMLGVDPTGGTDPNASGVIWVEDRRNFTESRWANLRLGTTAQSSTLTVFARIQSPFRWHGAHAFVDAFSLVGAPKAHFVDLPAGVEGIQATVRYDGTQSPDIDGIPGGTYQLLFDLQVRRADEDTWTDWLIGRQAGEATFTAGACTGTQAYQFRVRARSEQPEGSNGAWPNHRYPGDWSQPATVVFQGASTCVPRLFLPLP